VSALIIRTAWHLVVESIQPLMDAKLPADEVRKIRQVLRGDSRVKGYHKLRTRRSGGHRYADVHVQLADQLSLVEAHDITESLEDRAREQIPNLEITIHTEPYEAELRHQESAHPTQ
jgi:ferrous-iron efflux pump FieF